MFGKELAIEGKEYSCTWHVAENAEMEHRSKGAREEGRKGEKLLMQHSNGGWRETGGYSRVQPGGAGGQALDDPAGQRFRWKRHCGAA